MRIALSLLALGLLLSGCSQSRSPDGIWINQDAISAAKQTGKLREAILAYGPNLEWQLDSPLNRARFGNGFEIGEGALRQAQDGIWRFDLSEEQHQYLYQRGEQLEQGASDFFPKQMFTRPAIKVEPAAPLGSSFEQSLYAALLGGQWQIIEGPGQGGLVHFHPDGQVEGLPGSERYALCLAGDCADMAGEHDSLWLQLGDQGREWLFSLDGDQLSLFEAINFAAPDEKPNYRPGARRWLLERD